MNALTARLFGPLLARIPGRSARMLLGFARAELASMLDLRAAAEGSPSERRRALYLRHALDEERHARMLHQRGAELLRAAGELSPPPPRADTEALFESLGELAFVAFVHRGERRGRMQFEVHREAFGRRGDDKTRALFEALIADERRHEAYTWEILIEMAGGEAAARAALRRAAAWEAWRLWRRAGRSLAQLLYAALMSVLFVALLPWSLLVRVLRPVRPGWIASDPPGADRPRLSESRSRAPR